MAAEHEKFRLQTLFTENDYLKMFGNLFPVGRIWGVIFTVVTRFIQDVITGTSPEEIQDVITGASPDEIQDASQGAFSSSLFGQWLSVFGSETYRVEQQVTEVFNESVPGLSTIDGALPRWEAVLGLTETVELNPALTEADRQRAAHEKYTNTGILVNEEYLIAYAASLGFTIYIEYQDAGVSFIMGLAIMGLAQFATGVVDDRIEIHFTGSPTNIALCVEAFDTILPAHLIVIYIID